MGLLELFESVPLFDQHAHNVQRELPDLRAAFTEATDPELWEEQVEQTVFFRRSLRLLSSLYGCEPAELPPTLAGLTLEERTERCFRKAHLRGLLLDDGLAPEKVFHWSWHSRFLPVWRLLRVELLAEGLAQECSDFEVWSERLIESLARPPVEVVGYKTIAAYRGGLGVGPKVPEAARAQFRELSRRPPEQRRVGPGPLRDLVLHATFEAAESNGLPVQLHTGFGDPDLALEESNPLLLRPLIESYRVSFVLLHAGYPYARESGFLASVYRHVWVDFGLAVPFLSHRGMLATVRSLMELAPLSKLLYSSDASLIPELFYLGAHHGRRVLAAALEQAVGDGDLTADEAEQFGLGILGGNAERLYRLTGALR